MVYTQTNQKKNVIILAGILAAIGLTLFAYLMWYVSPEESIERVTVIEVNDQGCVVETFDKHAIIVDECDAKPGDFIWIPIDQKVKERAMLMNPTK